LVAVLVFLIVLSIVGWRGWQWYQGHKASQAMGYFEALQSAAAADTDEAVARIQAASATLRDSFSGSAYTPRGVLIAATALRERGDPQAARDQLQWLVQNGKDPAMTSL